MKFSTVFTTAASLLVANAAPAAPQGAQTDIGLEVETLNRDINHFGLTSKHEGAGFNGVFFDQQGVDFKLDPTKSQIYQVINGEYYGLSIGPDNFVLAAISYAPGKFDLVDGYLGVNNSAEGWAACKNIVDSNDMYHYSKKKYALMKYPDDKAIPDDCSLLRLKVHQK